MCEERSCEPPHSIYGDLAPRSVKADPSFHCPANRLTAHQFANTDRKTGHFRYFNIGLLIYYKRNAQRFLIVFTSTTAGSGSWGNAFPIRLIPDSTLSNAYKYSLTAFDESMKQRHLEQSWRAHPDDHRFFTSGIAPGVRHSGLVVRGVTSLQYERCTF